MRRFVIVCLVALCAAPVQAQVGRFDGTYQLNPTPDRNRCDTGDFPAEITIRQGVVTSPYGSGLQGRVTEDGGVRIDILLLGMNWFRLTGQMASSMGGEGRWFLDTYSGAYCTGTFTLARR